MVDLEIIYDFLAAKSQPAAQRIVETILERSRQLESFPESGPKQETVKTAARVFRYLVEGNYKIIYAYSPDSQMIYIAAIFDARNNPETRSV